MPVSLVRNATHRTRDRWLAPLIVGALLVVFTPIAPARAHTPHDTTSTTVMSPDYAETQVVYATSQNRLVRSDDGGASWATPTSGLATTSLGRLAVTPADPDRVYLTSAEGVYRSDDRGFHWALASARTTPFTTSAIAASPDDADVVIATNSPAGNIRTTDGGNQWSPIDGIAAAQVLTFGPAGTGLVALGTRQGELRTSSDDGATWTDPLLTLDSAVSAIAIASRDGQDLIFVGERDGLLWRSTDGGTTFTDITAGLPRGQSVNGIAPSPTFSDDGNVWVSVSAEGVYFSPDGGDGWERRTDGLTTDRQADEVDVDDFYRIDAGTGPDGETTLFVGGFDGPFRSDDGGLAWVPLETLSEIVVGLGVSPAYPDDGTVAVATYVKGAYLSTDRGETWSLSNNGLEKDLDAGNKFLPTIRLHNMVFSPAYAQDETIFSASWTRLLRSDDGGRSWRSHFVSDPPPGSNLRQFIIALSPAFADDGTIYLGTREGDIYVSAERGESRTFEQIGSVGSPVRTIEIHPDFPDAATLFASTEVGTFRSDDGGATWRDTGGPTTAAMLAISPDFAADQTLFAGTREGLLITRDGGATWEPGTHPDLVASIIEGVETSPAYADDQTVLISARGAGLFRSEDGGRSFDPVGDDLRENGHLLADFSNPTAEPIHFSPNFAEDRTVFGYGAGSVLRSTDAGDSWQELALPPASDFDVVTSLEPPATAPTTTRAQGTAAEAAPTGAADDTSGTSAGAIAGVMALIALGLAGAVFAFKRSDGSLH